VTATRACARPQSFDGRPLVGPVPGASGLFLAAGHGPWGISCGPATARAVVDAMLPPVGVPPAPIAPELRVDRVAPPPIVEVHS
jgi:glycine oxidase